MLKKLIKYDLLADYKKYAVLYAAMLFSSVMMLFFDKMTSWVRNNFFIKAMSMVFHSLFGVVVLVAAGMLIVFSTVRFYRNIVRDEGYLMHTLPVPTWQLLASKLVSVYIWLAATIAVSGICSGIAFGEPLWLFEFIGEFRGEMSVMLSYMSEYDVQVFFSVLKFIVFSIILSPLLIMSNVYFSFALGNLFNKSKLAMSVLMFFAIQVAEQIIGAVVSIVVSSDMFGVMVNNPDAYAASEEMAKYISDIVGASTVMSLVFSIGYMIAAERIFAKKLNLE